MNIALWCVQWLLAALFAVIALARVADSVSQLRRPSVSTGEPLFTRGESFNFGVIYLVGALGLISPALQLAVLHHRWIVPAAAVLLVVTLTNAYMTYGYGDFSSGVISALLLVVAILRAWPFPAYRR